MNPVIRRARSIPALCRSLIRHTKKNLHPTAHFTSIPRSLHSPPEPSNLSSSISDLLRNGGTWDSLTTTFPSVELNHPLAETVLLSLKEPSNAKKALIFFHWSSQHRQFRHSLRSYCITIHILVRAGFIPDARALLESAVERNLSNGSSRFPAAEMLLNTFEAAHSGPRVFDVLIQTYSKMRMVEQAFDACLYLWEHGFFSSVVSFNTMLHAVQKSGKNDLAWKVFECMLTRRVRPNRASVEIMIDALCKEGALQSIIGVLDRIQGKRCAAPVVIVNVAVAFRVFEESRVEEGIVLLKWMLQKNMVPDVVAYSLIVFGQCSAGELESACKVYDDMLSRGCSSNAFVYTCFIRAYCKAGRIDEADQLLGEMRSMGLKPYNETYSSLIEGCSKMRRAEESLRYYDCMISEGFLLDCSACNAMMGCICEAGEVKKANEILTVLLEKGFVPSGETYAKLMDGFGRIGKGDEILKLYYEMEHRGLILGSEVYTSLIENLRLCGKLKEAEKLQTIMREKPDPKDKQSVQNHELFHKLKS